MLSPKFSVLLAVVPLVAGHGYVQQLTVDGTSYSGWIPEVDPYLSPEPERIVRKIPGNGPVTDLSLIDVQCNGYTDGSFSTAPAPIFAPIAAGGDVAFNWTTWPDTHKGPIITYMAKAPSDITAWEPGTDAVWFKIDEAGLEDGVWAAPDGLAATNSVYTVTIPEALAPGQYIIRHEIIALHSAYEYPGAQVYPSCAQVEVTGSGTGTPTDLVAFPGAYDGDTPGIVFDVYNSNSTYTIPGPAVWSG
ncbi:lytic polysaccharide monooxygenase [Cylindrobasidium torrendii FP15055 ss-10]|uniref:lytic cellulose monooxygenase (C4-dehydrogenating) n=1 Tax=Cylindrobasidium torrendii FP15055 ss-10 TaxID=1314674 RepID=A0A0D7BSI2_9AGAR|nr:lytic polysaccharide monooxygenase [Cylindrobasidium torrendii FP15055 ss-10]